MRTLRYIIFAFMIISIIPIHFALANQDTRSIIRNTSNLNHNSGKLGTYRALIIGIQNYDDPKISDLKTPLKDARIVARVLRDKYGFKTTELLDKKATRKAIYNALRKLTNTAKREDSILIYYAGHGDIDKTFDGGWWIPVDAKGGDSFTYLENTLVQNMMKSIKSRHVLLISDSCYSGTLFGQGRAMPKVIDDKYYLNMYNDKSRWGMTSGNKTPVSDSGSDGHSVFAYQLIKKLKRNTKPYISTQEIYTDIAPIVANNSDQAPLCRPVKGTGDMGGEFIFVAQGTTIVNKPITSSAAPVATAGNKGKLGIISDPQGADIFLNNQYKGIAPLELKSIDPGTYKVMARLKNYDTIEKQIKINPNRKAVINFYFEKKETKGKLYISTQPLNCNLKIMDTNQNYTEGMELDPGQHKIQTSKQGYTTKTETFNIIAGEGLDLYVELKKRTKMSSEEVDAAISDALANGIPRPETRAVVGRKLTYKITLGNGAPSSCTQEIVRKNGNGEYVEKAIYGTGNSYNLNTYDRYGNILVLEMNFDGKIQPKVHYSTTGSCWSLQQRIKIGDRWSSTVSYGSGKSSRNERSVIGFKNFKGRSCIVTEEKSSFGTSKTYSDFRENIIVYSETIMKSDGQPAVQTLVEND